MAQESLTTTASRAHKMSSSWCVASCVSDAVVDRALLSGLPAFAWADLWRFGAGPCAGRRTDEARKEHAEPRGWSPGRTLVTLVHASARTRTLSCSSASPCKVHCQRMEDENSKLRDEIERQSGEQTEVFAYLNKELRLVCARACSMRALQKNIRGRCSSPGCCRTLGLRWHACDAVVARSTHEFFITPAPKAK